MNRPRPARSCLVSAALISGLLATPPAAAADPVLMFVLGFARNLIESTMEERARRAPAAPAPMLPVAPAVAFKAPSAMTNDDLRALVDDSFAYLSRAQRAELYAGLEKALADPALAPERDAMVAEFVMVARQVGFTHRQLERLSAREKRAVVDQFADNYRRLPPPQQQDLIRQLQLRALPLPADLNDMMLTALAP